MKNIKIKEKNNKDIKTLNKKNVLNHRIKSNIIDIKDKTLNSKDNNNENVNDYVINKTKDSYQTIKRTSNTINDKKNKALNETKQNIIKTKEKIKDIKSKYEEKNKIKESLDKITRHEKKQTNKILKDFKKEIFKQNTFKQKILTKTKSKYNRTKNTVKAIANSIKAIIGGIKGLIMLLFAGGWLFLVIIVVICLIGLLCSSIFGIFFSNDYKAKNNIPIRNVISECNKEFEEKLEKIQDQVSHDEYVLDGDMASWKDILIIYTVKYTNDTNNEVVSIDESKKKIIKQIFWDMNEIKHSVKNEKVKSFDIEINNKPIKEEKKKVLHITINSKSMDEMKTKYHLNPIQLKQIDEINTDKYISLWNSIIYGMSSSGEFVNWRQNDPLWKDINLGNSEGKIGNIGCLVTSIAILIEKSGINNKIEEFNPGTFVKELNKHKAFTNTGSLIYSKISEVIPNFIFEGNISLREKTKQEKLDLIKKYIDLGYYITAEVRGATPGNQHWVAVTNVVDGNIMMVDPATNNVNMWNAYNYKKTTQINYFKVKGSS